MTSRAIEGTVAPPRNWYNENAIEHTQCVISEPPATVPRKLPLKIRAAGQSRASSAAADQAIKPQGNPLTKTGDPQRRNDAREYIHRVVRPQNQHRCDFEYDDHQSKHREPFPAQAG